MPASWSALRPSRLVVFYFVGVVLTLPGYSRAQPPDATTELPARRLERIVLLDAGPDEHEVLMAVAAHAQDAPVEIVMRQLRALPAADARMALRSTGAIACFWVSLSPTLLELHMVADPETPTWTRSLPLRPGAREVTIEKAALISRWATEALLNGRRSALSVLFDPAAKPAESRPIAPKASPLAPLPEAPIVELGLGYTGVLDGGIGLGGPRLGASLLVARPLLVGVAYTVRAGETRASDVALIELRHHPLELWLGIRHARPRWGARAALVTTIDYLQRETLSVESGWHKTADSGRIATSLGPWLGAEWWPLRRVGILALAGINFRLNNFGYVSRTVGSQEIFRSDRLTPAAALELVVGAP